MQSFSQLKKHFVMTPFLDLDYGVEVPFDYKGNIPEGFECLELPEQLMLIFQSEPYKEEDFMEEILDLQNYIGRFNPKDMGYEWDDESYRFQFEPRGDRGYIEGRGVKKC